MLFSRSPPNVGKIKPGQYATFTVYGNPALEWPDLLRQQPLDNQISKCLAVFVRVASTLVFCIDP